MNILITGKSGFLARELSHFFRDHNVFCKGRNEIDLLNRDAVEEVLRERHYDIVIHTALVGDYKTLQMEEAMDNYLMFTNLVRNRHLFGQMFTFGSGAEKYEGDYSSWYSKHKQAVTRWIEDNQTNVTNLRLFGCFGMYENLSRFVSSCVYKKSLTITNKTFDFIYAQDVGRIIENYKPHWPVVIDCVYPAKVDLYTIASKVYEILGKDTTIRVEFPDEGCYYTGDATALYNTGVELVGLDKGLQETVNGLESRNTFFS